MFGLDAKQGNGNGWRRAIRVAALIAVSIVAGFVVFIVLFPYSFADTPGTCSSVFGRAVPCNRALSVAAGVATAVLVALVLFLIIRRR